MVKKIRISAILLAVILLGGSGCMNDFGTQAQSTNYNNAALEYMEKKYGEKFEFVSLSTSGFSSTYRILVSCSSLPDRKIYVQIENYTQKDRTFGDNFLAVKYETDTINFLRDCAASEYSEAIIFYKSCNDALSSDLPVDASFVGFLSDPQASISASIEVKAGSYTSYAQAEKVANLIAANGTQFWLTLVFVEDEKFGSYTEDELIDLVIFENYVHCAQITNLDDGIQVDWLREE